MKVIHKANWDYLNNQEIAIIFDKELQGVTIQPNQVVVDELRRLGIATLELYENRSSSTVYRIRQTGELYQLEYHAGEMFVFDDAEDYAAAEPIDSLIKSYGAKDPKYVIREDEGGITIRRTKYPRFTARYVPDGLSNLEIIEWVDPVDLGKAAGLMNRATEAVIRYLNNGKKS